MQGSFNNFGYHPQQQPQPQQPVFTFQQAQQQQVPHIAVKATVGDQTKRFRTPWPCTLGDMMTHMNKAFNKTDIKGTVQYCDEDNDWISVEKDEEWQEVQVLFSGAGKTLKLRIDNGQGIASKQLEQAIEKTLYQIDAFANALQREGAQAANSKPVRAVYESIRNKLEELIAPEIWAEIFGARQQQSKQAKEQEFTVQVDLKNSSVNLVEQKPQEQVPKPVLPTAVPTPQPVLPQMPLQPRPEVFPPVTTPMQPFIPQPTARPPMNIFGQNPYVQPPMGMQFGGQPMQQPQPPQVVPFGMQQQPQPVLNKTPDQSWTFLEVGNATKPVQETPFSFGQQPQPVRTTPQPVQPTITTPPSVVTPSAEPKKYTTELKQLQDMGLPPANLQQLLEKHNGNIAAVIQDVFAAQ